MSWLSERRRYFGILQERLEVKAKEGALHALVHCQREPDRLLQFRSLKSRWFCSGMRFNRI